MAKARAHQPDSAIAQFVQARVSGEEDVHEPSMQVMSVRVDLQTVADLEDLAGRLDVTRSMLARRLIEAGIEEAEAEWQRLHERGNG